MQQIILNSEEIKKLIPHRYPFLLVDKVIEIQIDQEILAVKNLSINEEVFQGHFPNHPVFPGVLSIEAIAQSAGILCAYSNLFMNKTTEEFDLHKAEINQNYLFYLTTIDNVKFRKTMIPGAQLFIKTKVMQKSSMMWKFYGEILIDNDPLQKAVEVNFSAFLKK